MNSKANRNVGPSRTRARARTQIHQEEEVKKQVNAGIDRRSWGGKFRFFGFKMALPHVLLIACAILFSLVGLMATSSTFTALPATIAQIILVINGAAVASGTQIVSLIPTLPVMIMIWIVGHRVRKLIEKRVTIRDLIVLWILGLGIPLITTSIALGMLWDASVVFDVGIAPVWIVYGRVILVYSAALIIGSGPRLWRSLARRKNIPVVLVDSCILALEYCRYLFLLGAIIYAFALLAHIPAVVDSMEAYDGIAGRLGSTLVSILYLPNAIMGTIGIIHGSELIFGAARISIFSVAMVPLPPVPLVAALPASTNIAFFFFLVLGIVAPSIVVYRKQPHFMEIIFAALWLIFIVAWVMCINFGDLGVYNYVGLNWLTVFIIPVWWLLSALIMHLMSILGHVHKEDERVEEEKPVTPKVEPKKEKLEKVEEEPSDTDEAQNEETAESSEDDKGEEEENKS